MKVASSLSRIDGQPFADRAVNISTGGEPAPHAGLPRLRFRVLLLGLVIAVGVPSLTLGVLATYRVASQQNALVEDRLRSNARAVALAVSANIAGDVQALTTLATNPALDPGTDLATMDQALRRASGVLGQPIGLVAPDGQYIIHTAMPPAAKPPPTVHLGELHRVLELRQPAVLDLHTGAVSHAFATALMVPVIRNGKAIAVLAMRLEIEGLRHVLSNQRLQHGLFATLVDSRHLVVAWSDGLHNAWVGKPMLPGETAQFDGRQAGLFEATSSDGTRDVFAFNMVPAAPGWVVFVAQPASDVGAAWREPLLSLGVGGALAMALGVAFAFLVARRIAVPLNQLQLHAVAVAAAHGEPVAGGAAMLPAAPVAELEALRRGFAAAEKALHRRAEAEQAISGALLASEERMRDLLATVELGAFMALDLDNTIRHWSAGCERLYGWTAAEAVGRIAYELLGTRFPIPLGEIEVILERDGGWTGELRHRARDGRELVLNAHQALRRDAEGHAWVLEVLTDLTAQRQTEATLGAVLDALPVGVIIANTTGRIVRDNAANRALWGVPPETTSWEGYSDWVGYRPETGERIKADEWAMARALLNGETVRGELVECEQFDTGQRRFYINNAAPVRDLSGTIIGGVVAELDVTEARLAEAKLAESEARLRTLIETVPVGLVLAEFPSGRIVSANGYIETLLRHPVPYSPDLDSHCEWVSFHADGTRVQAHEYPMARMALAGEENPSIEVLYQRGDGTRAWMRIMGRPVRDARGVMIGGVIVIVDVDAERRAHEAMTQAAADLERLVEERTQALRDSEIRLAQAAKMEALGRLASGVAHDFNNILQVVQGSADIAIRRLGRNPEQVEVLLGMARDAAVRGTGVTGRLLAFARRSELSAGEIAPGPLLDGLAPMLRQTLGPSVTLVVQAAPDVPALVADQGQLETVLVNLANNARDALGDGGGTITLSAATPDVVPHQLKDGRYVRLSVADNGMGMTPEVLERVSEPFFTTKPRGKGTGLGLAMARGFAEQSGGALTIDSVAGQGTTVSIWLRVAQQGETDATQSDLIIAAAEAPADRTVLLVDDDPSVRGVMAAILDAEGHRVIEAENAEAALRLLDGGPVVDVLVTDLSMPGAIDGLALVQEARQRRPGLSAMLVTGHLADARDETLEAGAAGGPFVLLRKPVPAKALVKAMETVLRGE